ncbi:right-handed parallel beta-helix repeat-containing protein [Planctomycetota bacterium]
MKKTEAQFYVATNGNDEWSGLSAAATSKKGDGPFATLTKARDAVREYKKQHPGENILVLIRDGMYSIDETIVFNLEDSGDDGCTITYAAYPGEEPVFSSGIKIGGWKKLESPPPSLPDSAKDKVWVADIPEGIGKFYTLYDGNERLPRACSEATSPTKAYDFWNEGVPIKPGYVWPPYDELHFPKGFLKNWSNLDDVEIVIRPHNLWVVNILTLAEVDEKNCVAKTKLKASYPQGILVQGTEEEKKESLSVENVFDVLDTPGEWVFNSKERKLYLWPKDDNGPGDSLLIPALSEYIKIEGKIDFDGPQDIPAKNLVFKGLTFVHGERCTLEKDDITIFSEWDLYDKDNALVRLRGAENCVIDGCHFYNSGNSAIRLDLHCQKNKITNNLIKDIGGTGVLLAGYGPGHKDVNRENVVANNLITRCGTIYWHSPAINIWQSGENRIAHNLIRNIPYCGIIIGGVRNFFFDEPYKSQWRENAPTIRWNDVGDAKKWGATIPFIHTAHNIIEYNEIYSALETLSDGNGIYISCTGPFNVIRRNYLHYIGTERPHKDLPKSVIRTDGWQKDTLICENICYECACGFQKKNYTHIENNYIINMKRPGRYLTWASFPFDEPTLGSRVMRNIYFDSGENPLFFWVAKYLGHDFRTTPVDCQVDFNLLYCAGNPEHSKNFLKDWKNGESIEKMERQMDIYLKKDKKDVDKGKAEPDLEYGTSDSPEMLAYLNTWKKEKTVDKHSISADPLFKDIKNGDFTLQPGSPALKLGIKQIDFWNIGLTEEFPEKYSNEVK